MVCSRREEDPGAMAAGRKQLLFPRLAKCAVNNTQTLQFTDSITPPPTLSHPETPLVTRATLQHDAMAGSALRGSNSTVFPSSTSVLSPCLAAPQPALAPTLHRTTPRKMASSALAPLVQTLQESLRSSDVRSWISGLDLKTGGLIILVVVAVLFLLDFFTKSYAPYGRSWVATAANAWLERDPLQPIDSFRGSRSLEPLTEVLDALATAAVKWGDAETPAVKSRAL
ncbi:uncharacterized protein LOC135088883 [Scylla paramamosain]|uniref:uncharacterized protein LOC135088883 n=1 Tax=Scylla paramamosain TaxID=85552 RepID=UPI003083BA9E